MTILRSGTQKQKVQKTQKSQSLKISLLILRTLPIWCRIAFSSVHAITFWEKGFFHFHEF